MSSAAVAPRAALADDQALALHDAMLHLTFCIAGALAALHLAAWAPASRLASVAKLSSSAKGSSSPQVDLRVPSKPPGCTSATQG